MVTYVFISVLVLITCILLGLIVLVQNSKGGGLASNFQSQNQVMGVRKTADFLEKTTWILAIILLSLSMMSVFIIPRHAKVEAGSEVKKYIEERGVQPVPFQPAPN